MDDEKVEKNVEFKKKKLDYNFYDVGDVDEYGMVIYVLFVYVYKFIMYIYWKYWFVCCILIIMIIIFLFKYWNILYMYF